MPLVEFVFNVSEDEGSFADAALAEQDDFEAEGPSLLLLLTTTGGIVPLEGTTPLVPTSSRRIHGYSITARKRDQVEPTTPLLA